jgi:TPR repeat protein
MTRKSKRQRIIRRAVVVAAIMIGGSMMGSQLMAQDARSCSASHGTVAAPMAQQFANVASAARAGNPSAMVEVAQMYRDGLGVTRDLILAQAWATLAASKGESVGTLRQTVASCLTADDLRKADAQVLALLQERDDEDL